MFRLCVVVPVYNHETHVGSLVRAMLQQELPCVLVDDGSNAHCAATLDDIVAAHGGLVHLVRHAENQGKGGAVLSGLFRAGELGFSHALQIDADGQHDLADVPAFEAMARANPQALIAGAPTFDDSVPRSRLYLRYLTHVMVAINTWSLRMRDSMCGFRVYPLDATLALARSTPLGRRMDFDIEIFVRLDWVGVPIIAMPTGVRYPEGGASHFRLWLDNVLITRVHTMLVFGMLRRAPQLLARKVSRRETAA